MRSELFQPTEDGEARLLMLIAGFSGDGRSLEGRTKLAKLDFLLRYPTFLRRALERQHGSSRMLNAVEPVDDIENRMVRYRYGPWDPAYFALLGRLIGKGLIAPVPYARGIGYKATSRGAEVAEGLATTPEWEGVAACVKILHSKFDWAGSRLTKFVYENFPEVAGATWGDRL